MQQYKPMQVAGQGMPQLPNQFQRTPQQYQGVPGNEDDEDDLLDDEYYKNIGTTKIYQIAHYAGYFNVTTMDVLNRLRKSLWPFCSKSMLFDDDDKVDLYGPIWIMLTLIVEIAIVGFINYQIDVATMAIELKGGVIPQGSMATYSLTKIARAGFVCIAYFLLNPLLMLLLIKYVLMVPQVQYIWLFAIYGYSFTIFVITTVLNVVPLEWLRWVFLGVSGLVSLFFIWTEMYVMLKTRLKQGLGKFFVLCLILAASHSVFVLALKEYFLT